MAVIWALRNGCSTAAAMVVCSLSATGQAAFRALRATSRLLRSSLAGR